MEVTEGEKTDEKRGMYFNDIDVAKDYTLIE
jgi:hypothetical protein